MRLQNSSYSLGTSTRKKKRIPRLKALLLGLFLLACGIAVWLGLFFFPAEWNLVSVAALLLGAVFVYFAIHFSARLLYLVGWGASWAVRFFDYAVVIGVLLKRGQTAAQWQFLVLWWVLFFVLILLGFFPVRINKK